MSKNIEFDLSYKIQMVEELAEIIDKKTTITESNYLLEFLKITIEMFKEFGFVETKKGLTLDYKYSSFIYFSFLPQYSKALGFDLEKYQKKIEDKFFLTKI